MMMDGLVRLTGFQFSLMGRVGFLWLTEYRGVVGVALTGSTS